MALGQASGTRLELDGVGKQYDSPGGTVQALADVSFAVSPGEFVCLVGPSGCGKTTLFRIVAGFEQPTTGTVRPERTTEQMNMGIVFQEYHLFPWRTVGGNIRFGMEQLDVATDKQRERTQRLVDLVGLEGFVESYPKSLSGGMKQRVALARALAVDPSLLLMDEPFSAVDAQTRRRLQENILDIHEETRKTILFVTHDIEEALKLGDRVVVMEKNPGRIAEVIDIDLPRPRSRTTPAFGDLYERVLDHID